MEFENLTTEQARKILESALMSDEKFREKGRGALREEGLKREDFLSEIYDEYPTTNEEINIIGRFDSEGVADLYLKQKDNYDDRE